MVKKKAAKVKDPNELYSMIICGTARVPEDSVEKHVFGVFALEIEIDEETTEVLDFVFTCPMERCLSEKILQKTLLGKRLDDGVQRSIEEIDKRLYCACKRAMIAALGDANRRYKNILLDRLGQSNPLVQPEVPQTDANS